MNCALAHIDDTGLFNSKATCAWKFLVWSEGVDVNAGMHGLVLYACKQINALASLISKPLAFESVVDLMSAAARAFCDDAAGVFVSGPSNQVSWTSAAWLSLSRAFPGPTCLRALKTAMADPKATKPLTPYTYHHVAEALTRNGGEMERLEMLRRHWGGMARAGADTFWECYDEADSRRSPYGDCHNNSYYCHAWSCTPSYLLRVV